MRGSPPLVRERLSAGKASRRFSRITPARAGKTSILEPTWFRLGDHPRSCGKDMMSKSVIDTDMGSPPLVRERRKSNRADGREPRITPARAGKTETMSSSTVPGRDHPRSCGKDSNGFLYFRPFTLTDVQNLFNFFAKHLTSSASPNAR